MSSGGSSGIRAGLAYIQLTLDDKDIAKRIAEATRGMADAGRLTARIGGGIAAAAGAVSAPFILGTRVLLDYVANLDFAAARVGIATEEFGRLAVAAKLTGTSVEALQIGVKTIGERIIQLKAGSGETTTAFKQLGINIQAFIGAGNNTRRLLIIAEALSRVKDRGLQAGLALRTMGEAGLQLIPLLDLGADKLLALQTRLREFSPTDKAITAARALRFEWTLMREGMNQLAADLATTIAPALTKLLNLFSSLIVSARIFVNEHPKLTATVGALALLGASAGAILLTVGALQLLAAAAAKVTLWLGALTGISSGFMGLAAGFVGVLTLWHVALVAVVAAVGFLADHFGLLNKAVALGTNALGFMVDKLSELVGLYAKILSYIPGFGTIAQIIQGWAHSAENFGEGMRQVDANQIAEIRREWAFGGESRGSGASGAAAAFGQFAAAGIMGSQASQQTLGFAGISGSTQQSLDELVSESRSQTNELREMNRRQSQTPGYRTW
jgi:hypothetical protein